MYNAAFNLKRAKIMTLDTFLNTLNDAPESVKFADTMALIDALYTFTPTAFSNGETHNAAGDNNGSCKILAFGQLQQLTEQQTLACFGHYFRDEVLKNPDGSDHQNIRNFMQTGWSGVTFDNTALKPIAAE